MDDLVNSLRSRTKIVFLDACRDNPALFKNLAKGRGSRPLGLAPADAGDLEGSAPGGGLFVAYAADSGSVASDGDGPHSPFTEALLRHLSKPVSVDDLFSLVTRDVRLLTNSAQRPYKYASLESIVCLTLECGSATPPKPMDIARAAGRSESEDYQIAVEARAPRRCIHSSRYPTVRGMTTRLKLCPACVGCSLTSGRPSRPTTRDIHIRSS